MGRSPCRVSLPGVPQTADPRRQPVSLLIQLQIPRARPNPQLRRAVGHVRRCELRRPIHTLRTWVRLAARGAKAGASRCTWGARAPWDARRAPVEEDLAGVCVREDAVSGSPLIPR